LLSLLREYDNLPLDKSLTNLAKVYNDVFVHEMPHHTGSYALSELILAEISDLETPSERLRTPFNFSFSKGTSKYINFS